jgi:hypothetical protein
VPVAPYSRLHHVLEWPLGGCRYEDLERVRKVVLLADVAESDEPGVRDTVVEHVQGVLVQDVAWPKQGHHVQEGVLVGVEQGREPERKWMAGLVCGGAGIAAAAGWCGNDG